MKIKKVKSIPKVETGRAGINPIILESINKCIKTKNIIEISGINSSTKRTSIASCLRTYTKLDNLPIKIHVRKPNIYLEYKKS